MLIEKMSEELRSTIKSVESLGDTSLKTTLTAFADSYDRILRLTKGNIQKYPSVKRLKEFFVPELSKTVSKYCSIFEDSDSNTQKQVRNELMELLALALKASENTLEDLQDAMSLDLSVDIQVLTTILKGSGITGSDFDIFNDKGAEHIKNAAGKSMDGDPFGDGNHRAPRKGLQRGYKREYDLQYEFFDDYYPIRTSGVGEFSNVIDDLQSNVEKAKKRVARMLQSQLSGKLVCVAPDIGYRALIDSVRMTDPESNMRLVQVVGIDFDKGIYDYNGEENIIGKEIVLLTSICSTGETFAKCRRVLFESGAAIVRCVALGRKVDYIPDERRRKR